MNFDYCKNSTWKNIPDICMIELTNACNFSCIMCSNKLMKREKEFMTIQTFEAALDACKSAGIKSLKLYTTGESMLHPNFIKFWQLATTYPFEKIMISTNGSMLTEKILDELIKSDKLKIQFSFCGWDKKSYESRYVGGNFEDAVEKIKLVIKKIKSANLPKDTLTINGAVSKKNGSIKKTKEFLNKEFGFDYSLLKIHNSHNWTQVISHKNEPTKTKKDTDSKKKYYCHIANTRIGILADGSVTACGCLDVNKELIIGNILKNNIEEIRKGKLFNEFVNKLNTGDISSLMCAHCDSLKELV